MEQILNTAVEALRARLGCGPDTDPVIVRELGWKASAAVTRAVTDGGHLHTQIASLTGCSGLRVIDYISLPAARSKALAVERNAAKNYAALVSEAMQANAKQRYGTDGEASATQIMRDLGVSRGTFYSWVDPGSSEATEAEGTL